jgi:hypothetical protein
MFISAAMDRLRVLDIASFATLVRERATDDSIIMYNNFGMKATRLRYGMEAIFEYKLTEEIKKWLDVVNEDITVEDFVGILHKCNEHEAFAELNGDRFFTQGIIKKVKSGVPDKLNLSVRVEVYERSNMFTYLFITAKKKEEKIVLTCPYSEELKECREHMEAELKQRLPDQWIIAAEEWEADVEPF